MTNSDHLTVMKREADSPPPEDSQEDNQTQLTDTILQYDSLRTTTQTVMSDVQRQQQQQAFQDITNRRHATAKQLVSIIKKGQFDEFIGLLHVSKPNFDLCNTFVNGNTALHHCLIEGRDLSWCKQLVANGANPNLSNKDGWHPLHLAAFSGHPEILAFLNEERRHSWCSQRGS